MATQKIWSVQYVVGNPTMFSKITTAAGGPFRRTEALKAAKTVERNGWRAWVQHYETGKRIFESEAEQAYKQDQEAKRIIEFAERHVRGFARK